ncbi:hypothetical protein [Streptomyces niveus]|uniref:hypothetical protein n=1 Tax=Streptomyces niveus TaxID=193462 RepID=UPI0036D3EFF1
MRLGLDTPTLTWLLEIRVTVMWAGDVPNDLLCVLEEHPETLVHWAIARYMPPPHGDIWARWCGGYDEPMHLAEWSGCLASARNGELCGGPAAHGYALSDRAATGSRTPTGPDTSSPWSSRAVRS